MTKINGDWFHSRSSSNISELLTVRKIINESKRLAYVGLKWSGGRDKNLELYDLARVADIEPSTMQTKVRTMIRLGFVKDNNECPIKWTPMGKVWDDLYSLGNEKAANEIYELAITTSLAMTSFKDNKYTLNPSKGDLPLKYLLNHLDSYNSILITDFEELVDGDTSRVGKNASYWIRDLINSGLFVKDGIKLTYTGKFPRLVKEIKVFDPDVTLTADDWTSIRQNPLIEKSPFNYIVKDIFEKIITNQNIETSELIEPLVEIIADQQERVLPQSDILTSDTRYTQSTRRVRNSTWSKRVKKRYNNKCAVPECDVEGDIFVQGCHIKPDNIENDEVLPHRAHVLNGICLCKHCHSMFDKGYFGLSEDCKIIVSEHINELGNQHIVRNILDSKGKAIKSTNDGRLPLNEFTEYHREFIFKK